MIFLSSNFLNFSFVEQLAPLIKYKLIKFYDSSIYLTNKFCVLAPSLNQNKPLYGSPKTQQSVNLALASSSEFLKEQLGLSLRTESSSSRPQSAPGTPRYKPQEDMYDEIIELKKV